MTTILTDAVAPRAATRSLRVFVPLALLAIVMAAVGFWPGYFGPVLGARKRRLFMLTATNVLLVAAVSRMQFLGTPPSPWILLLLWPMPIYIATVHDFVTKRLVHPAYVIGVLTMVAMLVVAPFRATDTWLEFSTWLATFYR